MKILAIDTSTKFLSVAITNDTHTLATFHDRGELQHSSLLLPTIDKLLKKCNLKLKDINAIALSIGPGSFTGLRIGLATCKGINLALGSPIVDVPTLDVIAYNFIDEDIEFLCPIIDAKKQRVYSCIYKNRLTDLRGPKGGLLEKLTDYMLIDINGLLNKIDKPTLVFGDGVSLYSDQLKKNHFVRISNRDWCPKAETVAKLGLEKAKKMQFARPDKLAPMYLHSKYCQVKVKA